VTWLAALLALAGGIIIGVLVARLPRRAPTEAVPRPAPAAVPAAIDDHAELDRLRAALDALPIGVILADVEGKVIVRNHAASNAVGTWRGDVLVDEAATALLVDALAGHQVARTLDLFGPPRRVVSITALPLLHGRGGAVIVIDDITERSRLDAVRTDFVANISHELKTPVGALSVLAETLADVDDPVDSARLSDKIVRESERLSRTIDDLLELSRIELGGQAVRDSVAVAPILHGAVDRVAGFAERHGIEVTVDDPGDGSIVLGDRRQLMSALANLVENAVKYSEPGGQVEVFAEQHDDHIALVVADHGIGIPERDLDRIFERFYRVDRARSRETGGTGLGLSIVRHVATNHGGTVSVVSTEGEGSEFRLAIPVALNPAATTQISPTPVRR
jgi:two-component system sensor histidine kinase SenX3